MGQTSRPLNQQTMSSWGVAMPETVPADQPTNYSLNQSTMPFGSSTVAGGPGGRMAAQPASWPLTQQPMSSWGVATSETGPADQPTNYSLNQSTTPFGSSTVAGGLGGRMAAQPASWPLNQQTMSSGG